VVSTDVADTIEGLMPNLMDIFAGSDEVVRFEPVGPEDESAAAQETDYVNHVFMQQNPGFMVLYSFIKDALLSKVGIVKVWWEEREEESRETYVRMDYEGDGRACLYQIITGGDQGEILRKDGKACITPFGAIPFATTTPVPITHRFFGRSIADLVMPVQREKTALKRGALDNLLTARVGACRCAQYLELAGGDAGSRR
jgi:hypothetical protein